MANGDLQRGVRAGLLVLLVLALAACEPAVALEVPSRSADQRLLDVPGATDATAVSAALDAAAEASGLDVVGLVFEDDRASLGQADRGGRQLLRAWDADVVLVAVARPGDFGSQAAERARYFGVYAEDRFEVPRGLREEAIFSHAQLPAASNDWTTAFVDAAGAVGKGLVQARADDGDGG